MKTSQLNASSVGRIPDLTKNAANRKENPPGTPTIEEKTATGVKQAKGSNRAEIVSSLKDARKNEKLSKDFENASPEVNEYLKMISRFENKVKQDQIEEADLERVMKALEDKVLSMNSAQQNRLKHLELFKKKGIDNFKNMKETLLEMFDNKVERETFFEFLKSPDFVSVLMNEQDLLKGYAPSAKGPAPKINPVINATQQTEQSPAPGKV